MKIFHRWQLSSEFAILLTVRLRRDVRVVYGASLENWWCPKGTGGSNPSLSANIENRIRRSTQVAVRGSPAKGVDWGNRCVGSNPTFSAKPSESTVRAVFIIHNNALSCRHPLLRIGESIVSAIETGIWSYHCLSRDIGVKMSSIEF